MLKPFVTLNMFLFCVTSAIAGELKNGIWMPANCGIREQPPAINAGTIDAYNASVKAIVTWQHAAEVYDACLVQEANADSALIAKTAMQAQDAVKLGVDKINADLESSRVLLEKYR